MANRDDLPAREPLFRPEVLAERQTQWLGTVLIAPRISHLLFAAFAVIAAAGILSLLFFGDFTRKERINGWLVPQHGIVRIFARLPGVVIQLNVQEGAEVRKGDPLLVISTELQSEAVGATREEIVRRLISRRDSLAAERDLHRELHLRREKELSNRLEALRSEQEHLQRELQLRQARLQLAQEAEERYSELQESGAIAEERLQQAREERLDQALKLHAIQREWAATEREHLTLEGELTSLPLQHRTRLAGIEREIAALEQEHAETEAQREIVVPAPQDGTVTGIQAELGGSTNTTVPLLTLIPTGSPLQAQLFGPSRAIGFVSPGQQVLLRYQAFPYQKFGHYEGTVSDVSRSPMSPSELTQQLFGPTTLYDTSEPVYRITVSLASQTVIAYGKSVPLQPGMQLEADVVIESRRLIEWVLDPLFTLTGKWQG